MFHDSSWNQGGQGQWQNPPFYEESNFAAFFPDLCPSGTAVCAATMTPTGKSMSDGFPLLTQPTNPAAIGGSLQSQNLNWKQGTVAQINLNVIFRPAHGVIVQRFSRRGKEQPSPKPRTAAVPRRHRAASQEPPGPASG